VDFLKSESINVLHETQDDIHFPVLSGVITPKQFVTCSILTYFASFVHLHRIWKQTPQPSIDHILKAPPSFSQSRTMSFSGKGLANAFSPSFLVHASFPFPWAWSSPKQISRSPLQKLMSQFQAK
jgi:hypothetical protein